ncbi:hypothetical protein IL54_2131 [Sphingobium sp. ba1]|nr:hypothetical protein IL54_2131 [Sphingobium sp. ba1]
MPVPSALCAMATPSPDRLQCGRNAGGCNLARPILVAMGIVA